MTTLTRMIPAPLLGEIPGLQKIQKMRQPESTSILP